jgi:hypothetical protein
MAELKTKPAKASVPAFVNSISDPDRRKDCQFLLKLMKRTTGAKPRMWGDSIVGFGSYTYKYPSGRQGEWFITGFSPRKQNLTLYFLSGFAPQSPLMRKLGKYTTGRSCLYVKRLADLDPAALKELIRDCMSKMKPTQDHDSLTRPLR